jgi:hypothetical protein
MLKFTHSYCACDKAWFLPVVHSGTPQQNGSNIPGNSTKEEADKEPAWKLKGRLIYLESKTKGNAKAAA